MRRVDVQLIKPLIGPCMVQTIEFNFIRVCFDRMGSVYRSI